MNFKSCCLSRPGLHSATLGNPSNVALPTPGPATPGSGLQLLLAVLIDRSIVADIFSSSSSF